MAYYLDRSTWEFRRSPPGAPVPWFIVALAAPLLGLALALFLPALGIWMLLRETVVAPILGRCRPAGLLNGGKEGEGRDA